jgi:hypothetical protein
MNGYYITSDNPTKKILLEPKRSITLVAEELIELVLPKCTFVDCSFNKLTELIITEDCEYIECQYNPLTKLIIPKNCKRVNCFGTKLPKLIKNLYESKDYVKMRLANNLQVASNLQK